MSDSDSDSDREPELTADERRALATAWTALEPPADFADRVLAVRPRRWLPYVAIASACAAVVLLAIALGRPGDPERPQVAPYTPGDAGPIAVAPPDATLAPADAAIEEADRYDLDLQVGQSATVHAPTGDVRIKFFDQACHAGLQIQVDRDPKFTAPTGAQGITGALVDLASGAYWYRGTCMSGGMPDPRQVSGRIDVVRDRLDRMLPGATLPLHLTTDNKMYRVMFSDRIPDVTLAVPPGGERLHVTGPRGMNRSFAVRRPQATIELSGGLFEEGDYRLYFERGGVSVGELQLRFAFDHAAPQFTIETPSAPMFTAPTAVHAGDVRVAGAVASDWTVAFEGIPIPLDARRRFTATVRVRPILRSLALQFRHPQRGIHYGLRR